MSELRDGVGTDRAGFSRYWGIQIFITRHSPWISLGVHFDWHTPTLDFHIGRVTVSIGKNIWEKGKRITFAASKSSGHTNQCTCANKEEAE